MNRLSFRWLVVICFVLVDLSSGAVQQNPLEAQEAQRRWEVMNQIRLEKFDTVLPAAMLDNDVEMWIVMRREGYDDPLTPDLGAGYVGKDGYYVFSLRPGSSRVERAALGISGYLLEQGGAYDYFGSSSELAAWVAERDPKTIGVNLSSDYGAADGMTKTGYEQLQNELGERFSGRLVSAHKLASQFRSTRTALEVSVFSQAGEISRELAERAFSEEVISAGVTRLEDVAWWLKEETFKRGLGLSFGMPSVYITGPEGVTDVSNERVIQSGDLLMLDWGVGLMNLYTDMKRIAYVLKPGEVRAPPGLQNAFDRGIEARRIVRRSIRAGVTAQQAMDSIYEALSEAGFPRIPFNQPTDNPETTDIVIGCHSVGNTGHGIGPSIAEFNPVRLTFDLKPSNLLSIELFAYTAAEEFGGKKVRIPLEDDGVVTERGVDFLYPAADRILLIHP